jgi:hypothetical protein
MRRETKERGSERGRWRRVEGERERERERNEYRRKRRGGG